MAVHVESPSALDEWEVSWYRETLYDRSLITAGVVVVIDGTRFLAVPVGGRRRGGWIPVRDPEKLQQLHDALKDRDGFPLVRMRWSNHPDVCHSVAWGDPHPRTADRDEVFRFYGHNPVAADRAGAEELAHA